MITAIVLLTAALLAAIAYIVRGALLRYFDRETAFERVWDGEQHLVVDAPIGFRTWIARFGRSWVS